MHSKAPSRRIAVSAVVCIGFALAACNSSPTKDLPSTATAAQSQAGPQSPQTNQSTAGDSTASVVEAPLPPQAVQQFEQALVHMNAGDTAVAEQDFKSLAAAYPTFAGPWINLGIIQAKAGKLAEAEQSFKTAVERNANSATAYNELGIVYRKLGRFKEADEAYQHAIQADPNYANAYLNLGVLCDLYLQQPERALEAYEHYLSLSASPDRKVTTWVSELKRRTGAAEQHTGESEG